MTPSTGQHARVYCADGEARPGWLRVSECRDLPHDGWTTRLHPQLHEELHSSKVLNRGPE